MSHLANYLEQTDSGWEWQLPEQFNIGEACVDRHVKEGNGEKPAFILEDANRGTFTMSYQQLSERTSAFANLLNNLRFNLGERVLIRLPNSLEYPTAFFGSLKYGAVAVPTSTLLSAEEVAYLANDSGATAIVTDKKMWPQLAEALAQCKQLKMVLLTGEGSIHDLPKSGDLQILDFDTEVGCQKVEFESRQTRSIDPAYLVYTSGTTGYPKGVLHAHRALIGRLPASEYWFDFKEDDRILHSGKFNWTYVLGSALMDPLFHGKTVVVYEGPNDATTWPKLIAKHQCTIFIGVPTIYRQIIQKTEYSAAEVPSLRHCMSAGEHLSDEMLLAWRERFNQDVYEAIGMSELSYYISQHKEKDIRPGAAGFPQPGHNVTLLGEDNQPVTAKEEGMICIPLDDPGLFLEYWRLPEETAKAKVDGYFRTGDYARYDDDGYIWFVGRKDDIINTFGYRVSPHEVERVMKTHPAVADCVALGEEIGKDKVLVSICVILQPDANASEDELLSFGASHLAKYKAPKKVHFMEDYPRTKNGKVLRKQLIASLKVGTE
ncbi:acyl-CoA synthetase [Pleionea sp. CnH1-48]|uniref:acyl-CoA synthetase n=1 Tax=Pleionea sp. CnH1-48 TaxID=2954494 RepID=UPI002097608C|nr:acyl-CoA synthetase [Pleionea sp. CnH1-48]MCO7226767.1 acyl-CoA synthetase [Pleionea sp. CnH1-48]